MEVIIIRLVFLLIPSRMETSIDGNNPSLKTLNGVEVS